MFQRLKAAVHYTVGCLCAEAASDKEVQLSKQTVAAIAEVTFRQCGRRPWPSCVGAEAGAGGWGGGVVSPGDMGGGCRGALSPRPVGGTVFSLAVRFFLAVRFG